MLVTLIDCDDNSISAQGNTTSNINKPLNQILHTIKYSSRVCIYDGENVTITYTDLGDDEGYGYILYERASNEKWWICNYYAGTYEASKYLDTYWTEDTSILTITQSGAVTFEILGSIYSGQLPDIYNGEIYCSIITENAEGEVANLLIPHSIRTSQDVSEKQASISVFE